MSARATFLLNYLAYQVGWLAAIAGAGTGHGIAGAVVAAVLTAGHVILARERGLEAALVVAALLVGWGVESWQLAAGTYRLLEGAPATTVPPWLLALWAQFATACRFSLARVMTRPWRAALFGALGGPVAFLAGERLGAVNLQTPLLPTLTRLLVAWALALAALAWLARAMGESAGYRGPGAQRAGGQRVALPRSSAPT